MQIVHFSFFFFCFFLRGRVGHPIWIWNQFIFESANKLVCSSGNATATTMHNCFRCFKGEKLWEAFIARLHQVVWEHSRAANGVFTAIMSVSSGFIVKEWTMGESEWVVFLQLAIWQMFDMTVYVMKRWLGCDWMVVNNTSSLWVTLDENNSFFLQLFNGLKKKQTVMLKFYLVRM